MLINGENTPAARYCPEDTITFTFRKLDTNIPHYTFEWKIYYHDFSSTDSIIKYAFPLLVDNHDNIIDFTVTLVITIPTDTVPVTETLTNVIHVDYIRTILDTPVCQGRDITVHTATHGDITYLNVQEEHFSPWDTLQSHTGCDSLVCWHIIKDSYIEENYAISSCDSVIWGDIIIKRPPNQVRDYETTVERLFLAADPDMSCDTLKKLKVTIIDTAQLKIKFDQKTFCANDDAKGTIELETNFTAFDWKIMVDKKPSENDTAYTCYEKKIDIEYSGYYYVTGYMDERLCDTLTDLKIVNNCSLSKNDTVKDCFLIIPDVITPNNDNVNDVFGIKKLNPRRENELTIYDRWGKKVFHQKNYKCVFKNSTFENTAEAFSGFSTGGRKLPEGTYYYAFKYYAIPNPKTYTGTLLIFR